MTRDDSPPKAATYGRKSPNARRSEGLARAVYALIIITALLGELESFVDTAAEAIAVVLGTALVLFLAHSYSDVVSGEFELHWGRWPEIRDLLIVEAPLLMAASVPVMWLLLAEFGAVSLSFALDAAILCSLVSLALIGTLHGRTSGRGLAASLLAGIVYSGLGAAIILLEVAVD